MTRRYWLSFCDDDKPEGESFLGVAVVEVTEADAAVAKAIIDRQFPQHQSGAEWIAAATRKAWDLGCNPGGQVASLEVTNWPVDLPDAPLGRLLSKAELLERGLIAS